MSRRLPGYKILCSHEPEFRDFVQVCTRHNVNLRRHRSNVAVLCLLPRPDTDLLLDMWTFEGYLGCNRLVLSNCNDERFTIMSSTLISSINLSSIKRNPLWWATPKSDISSRLEQVAQQLIAANILLNVERLCGPADYRIITAILRKHHVGMTAAHLGVRAHISRWRDRTTQHTLKIRTKVSQQLVLHI